MLYRPYHPADFSQLYAIEEECFQPPVRFSQRYMRQLLTDPRNTAWIAEDDGVLGGFAIVELAAEPEGVVAYIQTIEVASAFRRRGIASGLLDRIEHTAQAGNALAIWLHVEATNVPAIALYQAHGYVKQGTERHYYARRRDADILVKPLHQLQDGPAR